MKRGIVVLVASAVWSLFLLVRVRTLFGGQRFLLVSGSNEWDWSTKGIALSDWAFIGLWLLALVGFATGSWLIVAARKRERLIRDLDREVEEARRVDSETKPCPRCAERVRLEARACRFCGHEFTAEEAEVA